MEADHGDLFVVRSYPKKRGRNAAPAKNRKRPVITVRSRPGHPSQGLLNVDGAVFPCALGRGGISADKREGDGATPLATMRLGCGFFRRGRFQARRFRAGVGLGDADGAVQMHRVSADQYARIRGARLGGRHAQRRFRRVVVERRRG